MDGARVTLSSSQFALINPSGSEEFSLDSLPADGGDHLRIAAADAGPAPSRSASPRATRSVRGLPGDRARGAHRCTDSNETFPENLKSGDTVTLSFTVTDTATKPTPKPLNRAALAFSGENLSHPQDGLPRDPGGRHHRRRRRRPSCAWWPVLGRQERLPHRAGPHRRRNPPDHHLYHDRGRGDRHRAPPQDGLHRHPLHPARRRIGFHRAAGARQGRQQQPPPGREDQVHLHRRRGEGGGRHRRLGPGLHLSSSPSGPTRSWW